MDYFQNAGSANVVPGRYEQLVEMFPDYDIDLILTSFPTHRTELVVDWILLNSENAPKKRRPPKRRIEERSSTDEEEYFSDEDEIVEGLVLQKLLKELYSKYIIFDQGTPLTQDIKTFLGQVFPSVRLDFIARSFTHNKNICSTMIACWFVANKCTTKLRDLMNNPEHIMWITTDPIQTMRRRRVDIIDAEIPEFRVERNRTEVIKFKDIMVNLSNKYPRILNGTKLTKEAFTLMIEIPEGVEMFECGVCFVQKTIDKRIQCGNNESELQHSFCRTCLRGHAAAASEDMPLAEGAIGLKCMEFKCQNAIIYANIRSLIPKKIRKIIDDRILEENLGQSGLTLERCRECNYGMEMVETKEENKVFECQNCEKNWCRLCQREWNEDHFGLTCEEVDEKNNINRRQRDLEAKLNEVVIRRCHRCGLQYMKQEGCNKMTCRCGATQCYVCKKTDITYDHFCRHPRAPGINRCDQCTGNSCTLWQDAKQTDDEQIERIQREEGLIFNRPKTPEFERNRLHARDPREQLLFNGFINFQRERELFQPLVNFRNEFRIEMPRMPVPPPIPPVPQIANRFLPNIPRQQIRQTFQQPPPRIRSPPRIPSPPRPYQMPQYNRIQNNFERNNEPLFQPILNYNLQPQQQQQRNGIMRPVLQPQQPMHQNYQQQLPQQNYYGQQQNPFVPRQRLDAFEGNLEDMFGRQERIERNDFRQPVEPIGRYGEPKKVRFDTEYPDWRRRRQELLEPPNYDEIGHLRNYQQNIKHENDRIERLVEDVAAGNFNNNGGNVGDDPFGRIFGEMLNAQNDLHNIHQQQLQNQNDPFLEWNNGNFVNDFEIERNAPIIIQEEINVDEQNLEDDLSNHQTEEIDNDEDDDDLEIIGQNFQHVEKIQPKRNPIQIAIDRLGDGAPTYEFIPLGIENYQNAFKDLITDVNVLTEFIIDDATNAAKILSKTFQQNYPELKNGQESESFKEFADVQKEFAKVAKNQKEINNAILRRFEQKLTNPNVKFEEISKKKEFEKPEINNSEPKPGPSRV